MPAQRYRYIGATPAVFVPDMKWGDPNDETLAVHPGDVSEPFEGEIHSDDIVPMGSEPEQAWLAMYRPDQVNPTGKVKGGSN